MFPGSRARGADGLPVLGKGKQIALDVARGLAFLHSQHVVHLDLKSPNGACRPVNPRASSTLGAQQRFALTAQLWATCLPAWRSACRAILQVRAASDGQRRSHEAIYAHQSSLIF